MKAKEHSIDGLRSDKITTLFAFMLIPTITLVFFVIYPTIKLVYVSFTDWDGISRTMKWIGFTNYKRLFTIPELWVSLQNNALYFFLHLMVIPVSLYVAFALNFYIKKSGFYKSVFFMPSIINGVAISYMFSFLFSSQNGFLNVILNTFGIGSVPWLSDPTIVKFALVSVSIWTHTGMTIMLYLAGMQALPTDMLEAATVDGASLWDKFIHIIIPNMMTVIGLVMFLNARGALMQFEIPFIMTSGGPNGASSTYALYLINTAFQFTSFGLASAMAIVLILIVIILASLQSFVLNRVK